VTPVAAARLALAAWALGAGAAAADVVVLSQPSVPQYAETAAGFREVRTADVVDAADDAAVKAALSRRPAVVVAIGSKALEVARARAAGSSVVAAAVLSLAAGEAGVGMEARAEGTVAALRSLAPGVKRLVVLHPPGAEVAVADARSASRAAGFDPEFLEVGDLADFQGTFRRALEDRDAVWILPDPRLARPDVVKFMVTTCLERRLPLLGFLDGMTRTGALLSVAADFRAIGREAARLTSEVESRPQGARDVPPRFAPGKLSVNERVREMLGLPGHPPRGAEIVR
jgi:ABC-type uncharacterized transport system substrate-binding protein